MRAGDRDPIWDRHVSKKPDPSTRVGLFDADQSSCQSPDHAQSMQRIDWVYGLSLAATLALAVGAICILLFAM
jgi:hypothetical protein